MFIFVLMFLSTASGLLAGENLYDDVGNTEVFEIEADAYQGYEQS